MARQKKWDLKTEIADMKKSHANAEQAAWFRDASKQELERLSASPTPDFFQITQLLSRYAGWEGVHGAIQIYDHDGNGWQQMQKSLRYRFWSTRIRFALCDRTPGQVPFLMGIEPLVLAHAICTHQDDVAHWLGNRGVRSYELTDAKTATRFQHFCTPVNRFVLQLYGIWTRQEVRFTFAPKDAGGAFKALVDHWSEQDYSKLMLTACDFYINESNKDSSELGAMPYNVFPAPLLAVLRVRKDLKLMSPTIDHPLLTSELAQIPLSMSLADDDLLAKIEKRAKEAFPEIGQSPVRNS